MIERVNPVLPVLQQCRLLAVSRAAVYRKPAELSAEDLAIMALIDRQYLARPYYGSRRMAAWLGTQGHLVNRKRVQRLMRLLGLAAIYQRPNTRQPAVAHKIYPYLLGGISITRVNQVWCSDVTYIPMAKGFLYLVVIMDWVSRAVLAWRLSNTLAADFCVEALEEALARYGRPEIFNTDQGSQFTSDAFTGTLKRHEVMISMDGKSLPSRKRGPLHGQHLRRAAVAPPQIRGSLPQRLRDGRRGPDRHRRLAPVSTTRSASTRASAIVRRGKFTRKACGYVDDRLWRPAALPPLPEQARKAAKCSPSPPYPQASQPIQDLILMK